FILSLVFLVLCFGVFFFLYQMINNNTQKTQKNLVAFETEASRREDIRSLDRSLQKVADARAELDTHFAQSSDVVPFLDTVEKLAPEAGAQAQVSSVDTLPNKTGLVVGLKASGSFEALYKFMTLLENSPYELNFLSMDLSQSTGIGADKAVGGGGWTANLKIQLLSFIQ
ncbi:MAG: hypothetical protein ACREGC_00930, partial [Minisyncoccia bacterium]